MDERHQVDPQRRKGRGAITNHTNRFERKSRVAVHDGWDLDEDLPPLRTEVSIERPRSMISRNTSPDLSFDRSINPYRGCEHGCVYCFARPSHAFLGLSPGLDFETKLIARPAAPQVLKRELARKGYRPQPMAIGTNTDPYQPIEGQYRIMRAILRVLADYCHPVTIVTKGTLIERDIDILSEMAGDGLVRVGLSITTLDRDLSRRMEPRVPDPARRLRGIERLAAAGIPVRVSVAPIVPGLTDHEMEQVLTAARNAGAVAATWSVLRLPREVSPLWREWLEANYPNHFNKVMGHIRAMHGGEDYAADWGKRMRGAGPYAVLLAHRFKVACKKLGLVKDLPPLRCDLFQVPAKPGDQLTLF
ncbi:PA0069 family radical SAM protein [Actibacterium sp. 188UL27-1]|uniref:PA0069 family radical SAM protein n=1 Tax=Actibacterium sp. 188UL27-1 TaxID=2786961 RepID=UPI00195AA60F|nr:PA0069 family radical SAM protein [Actibacterium sp. 188UL27-1]MBM7069701.1 PA0069 family radical SAM protein [Actibacterium sp. 188UL27-1]